MTKTKQTIYKTSNGCYKVGDKYFAYLNGALKESTKEECRASKGKEDLVRVNSEDFINAVYDVWQKQDDNTAFLSRYGKEAYQVEQDEGR
jgi:hypothetical protein